MKEPIAIDMRRQPDDTACGPTCLEAVYRFYGEDVELSRLLSDVPRVESGGTHAVHLANHALARGYDVQLITWNLQVFDPTWFQPGARPLRELLLEQMAAKTDRRLREVSPAYIEFVERGGRISYDDLRPSLLRALLKRRVPIITGLSATFLYRAMRERPSDQVDDDVRGEPVGHFVVLAGYDPSDKEILVSDPQHPNPLSQSNTYRVRMNRLIGAIYLGVLTFDGNLLILSPRSAGKGA
jgi:hypothetical protein